MPRPNVGSVIEKKRGDGVTVFKLRVTVAGKRHQFTLGTREEGWTRQRAEEERANTRADIRRGRWKPPMPAPEPEPEPDAPTFHEFASEWLERRRPELRAKTIDNYRWALAVHLLPVFKDHTLAQITREAIDNYKAAKLREGKLGPNQINTTLTRLAQVLEDAVDYGLIEQNPAAGKRRRVKGTKPERPVVQAEQLPTLLDIAGRLRPLLATLAGAGLRCGEACALEWRDVNLASGTLTVRASKTDAGAGRVVDLPDALREELAEAKFRAGESGARDRVFLTRPRSGAAVGPQTVSNVGRRMKTAVRRANERLDELGIEPITEKATPHSLRRSYASIRYALGDDPITVANQMGHTKPDVSLEIYAKALKRRERLTGVYRREFDRALEWARIGTADDSSTLAAPGPDEAMAPQTPVQSHDLHSSPDSSAG